MPAWTYRSELKANGGCRFFLDRVGPNTWHLTLVGDQGNLGRATITWRVNTPSGVYAVSRGGQVLFRAASKDEAVELAMHQLILQDAQRRLGAPQGENT